jgi:hypothetical protein
MAPLRSVVTVVLNAEPPLERAIKMAQRERLMYGHTREGFLVHRYGIVSAVSRSSEW